MSNLVARLQVALLERRTIRTIAWFVAVGALLYLSAIFWFGWQEIVGAFTVIGLQVLVIGAVLSSSSYLWRFWRWEYVLRLLGHSIPKFAHLGIYLSGLALTATPGKTGETFRSALLVQHNVRVTHSLAAFLVDRGSDVLGVTLLGALAAFISGQHVTWVWILSFVSILLASIAFAYLLLHPVANIGWGQIDRSLSWIPIKGGQATLEVWARVWTLPRVSIFSITAMIAYGTQAMVFAWFCHILGAGISVADCVLIIVQATLFGAASLIPGGLGAMEAALIYQLLEHGLTDDIAVSLAISFRLVTLWIGILIGLTSLLSFK